jgi:hypothetical protein
VLVRKRSPDGKGLPDMAAEWSQVRSYILKVMSKRNVSRKDADSEQDFRISIFFEAGEYFVPEC